MAILTIIGGIFILLGGVLLLVVGAAAGAGGLGAFGGLIAVVGALIALFGLLWIVAGIGLWRLRGWAWWLAMIVSVVNIIFGAVGGDYVSLAIGLIIAIYLVVVRRHFGIGGPAPAAM